MRSLLIAWALVASTFAWEGEPEGAGPPTVAYAAVLPSQPEPVPPGASSPEASRPIAYASPPPASKSGSSATWWRRTQQRSRSFTTARC